MTIPGNIATIVSASLIFRLSRLIPGSALGTADTLAADYNVEVADIVPILSDLVTLEWLMADQVGDKYVAGRRAGDDAWPTVEDFVKAFKFRFDGV